MVFFLYYIALLSIVYMALQLGKTVFNLIKA